MHLVNILRIITFSFLVGHSILTISDFNGFRFFLGHPVYRKNDLYLCINALSGTIAVNCVTARAVFDAGHISGDIQQIFSQYSRLVFPAYLREK
jgi:hypothetical protein